MTNVIDLFTGVGVLVDDDLATNKKKNGDHIWKIKSSFEKKNIPLLIYTELPNGKLINFSAISFLLLDWDLYGLAQNIPLPQAAIDDNIDFIKQFNKNCFAPIFIFSNEDVNYIKLKLQDAGLYDIEKSNHIFVKSKNELKNSTILISEIKKWLKATPSIYVLKEWENSINQAKQDLFWEFYQTSHNWPKILQQTFKTDGVDEHYELSSLLYKNLIARSKSSVFDEKMLVAKTKDISKNEIRKVLECERYISNKYLPNIPNTGDIFKDGKKYYINIRPECDLLRIDNPQLYCLKGEAIKEEKINKKGKSKIPFQNGTFLERADHSFVSFIDGGKIIEFKFKNLEFLDWDNKKVLRIGRLLPPYITRIQQRYTFYLQRQALPAIPEKAIK